MGYMMRRYLLFCLAILFLVACGGEFEDEFYEDEGEAYADEEEVVPVVEDEEYVDEEEGVPVVEDEEYVDEEEGVPVVEDEEYVDEEEGAPAAASIESSGQFATAECPFDVDRQYDITCGYLTVPENRETGSDTTIDLAIAILHAGQDNSEPDPVIYLDGGPGGSALSSLEAEPDSWAAYGFARTRDIVFIDQRGTGYSQPSLNCPEMDDDYEGLDNELDCQRRLLEAGIDLTAYNTAENGTDVADLADALGLESYNLVGISYGTYLALAVMRDHPEKVRSVVLDSPFPPNSDPAIDEAALTYDRILALIALCEQDTECLGAYPDLETVLIETVERMNSDPPSDDMDGDLLLQTIYQALFSADQYASAIPLLIYLSYEEEYDFLAEIADELLGGGFSRPRQSDNDGDSEGMYTSVLCHDEFSFATADQAEDRTADVVPVELRTSLSSASLEFFELCEAWGAGEAADWANAAVVSDIPTLIVVGELDPATPPVWGELALQTLENGVLYIVGGSGHSLLSTNDCVINLSSDFIADPYAPLNDSCIDQQPAIDFEY